jgi:formate--tetrahydrofolate ligase
MSVQPRETAKKPGRRSGDQHKNPKSDIEISQAAEMRPIVDVAKDKLGIDAEDLIPYGHYKAKVALDYVASLAKRPSGKLILVTAITPARVRPRPPWAWATR